MYRDGAGTYYVPAPILLCSMTQSVNSKCDKLLNKYKYIQSPVNIHYLF